MLELQYINIEQLINGYERAIDSVFDTENFLYYKDDLYLGNIDGHLQYYLRGDNLLAAGYIRAERYGNYNTFVKENEAIRTEDGKIFISNYHASEHGYHKCWKCGKYTSDTTHKIYVPNTYNEETYNGNLQYICNDCFDELLAENKLLHCDDCGRYRIKLHDTDGAETSDDYLIDTNFNRINARNNCPCTGVTGHNIRYLMGYHNYRNWETRKASESDTSISYGMEIESTPNRADNRINSYDANKVAGEVFKNCCIEDYGIYNQPIFRFEEDGSIRSGIETITQPLTINWIHENEHRLANLCDVLIRNNMISHDSDCCGLHIHIDKHAIDSDTLSRMIYIFEKYQLELVRFSRRQYSELVHWASFLNIEDKKLTMDYAKSRTTLQELASIRYRALNITNSNTVEVRIFKGTLKYETIIASVELVDNIVTMCREISDTEIIDKSFVDIIKYKQTKYLKGYCIERRLVSYEELEEVGE